MMQTVNERLRDESIAHAVWISRYSTGVAARMVKILNDSDAELTARLLIALDSLDPGSFTVKRLESLLASVREVSGPSSPHLPLVQEMTSQPLLTEGRRQPGFSVAPVAWEYPEQISFRWSDAQIP